MNGIRIPKSWILLIVFIVSVIGAGAWVFTTPPNGITNQTGSFFGNTSNDVNNYTADDFLTNEGKQIGNIVSPNYIIVNSSGTVRDCGVGIVSCIKAINGSTLHVDYSGTDFDTIFQNVLNSPSSVVISPGDYYSNNGVLINNTKTEIEMKKGTTIFIQNNAHAIQMYGANAQLYLHGEGLFQGVVGFTGHAIEIRGGIANIANIKSFQVNDYTLVIDASDNATNLNSISNVRFINGGGIQLAGGSSGRSISTRIQDYYPNNVNTDAIRCNNAQDVSIVHLEGETTSGDGINNINCGAMKISNTALTAYNGYGINYTGTTSFLDISNFMSYKSRVGMFINGTRVYGSNINIIQSNQTGIVFGSGANQIQISQLDSKDNSQDGSGLGYSELKVNSSSSKISIYGFFGQSTNTAYVFDLPASNNVDLFDPIILFSAGTIGFNGSITPTNNRMFPSGFGMKVPITNFSLYDNVGGSPIALNTTSGRALALGASTFNQLLLSTSAGGSTTQTVIDNTGLLYPVRMSTCTGVQTAALCYNTTTNMFMGRNATGWFNMTLS